MNVDWALLCQKAEFDEHTRQLNVHSELDIILANTFPFDAPPFVLVALISQDDLISKPVGDSPRTLRIKIESPSGEVIAETLVEIRQNSECLVCDLLNQRFPVPGNYAFHLVEADRILHTLTLHIVPEVQN